MVWALGVPNGEGVKGEDSGGDVLSFILIHDGVDWGLIWAVEINRDLGCF